MKNYRKKTNVKREKNVKKSKAESKEEELNEKWIETAIRGEKKEKAREDEFQ